MTSKTIEEHHHWTFHSSRALSFKVAIQIFPICDASRPTHSIHYYQPTRQRRAFAEPLDHDIILRSFMTRLEGRPIVFADFYLTQFIFERKKTLANSTLASIQSAENPSKLSLHSYRFTSHSLSKNISIVLYFFPTCFSINLLKQLPKKILPFSV
jgi:hypothetical protein